MLDPQDELYDRRLASHLVSLYHISEREAEEEFVVSIQAVFRISSVFNGGSRLENDHLLPRRLFERR